MLLQIPELPGGYSSDPVLRQREGLTDVRQSFRQRLIVASLIADPCHAHDYIAGHKFRKDIPFHQFSLQRQSIETVGAHIEIYLGVIQTGMFHDLKSCNSFRLIIKPVQAAAPFFHELTASRLQYLAVHIQRCHEQIRRAGTFQLLQRVLKIVKFYFVAADVHHRALCK